MPGTPSIAFGQPDAVPMHRGVLGQPVLDRGPERRSLTQPQHRAGLDAVIGPDLGFRDLVADQADTRRAGLQQGGQTVGRGRMPGAERRPGEDGESAGGSSL
jgi:hypothetical protein